MKIKDNIAISENGFLFHPGTGDSFTVNSIGLELIKLLHEGKDEKSITAHFTSKYDVDEHSFERYFVDFLNTLKQFQLLTDE